MILAVGFISSSDRRSFVIQLVASADCAGALDVTDDLLHLLVFSHPMDWIVFIFLIYNVKMSCTSSFHILG